MENHNFIVQQLENFLENKKLLRINFKTGEGIKFFYGRIQKINDNFVLLQNNKSLRTLLCEINSIISIEEISEEKFKENSPKPKLEKDNNKIKWLGNPIDLLEEKND